MTDDLRDVQRRFFRALRDRPLDLSDPADEALYEPLYEGRHDPVVRLHDTIDFSVGESVQLIAGFRGTGKTTEFSRLEARLWKADYLVIRVDLDHYLDLHSPIGIADFLLALSGAISDVLLDERLLGPRDGAAKSFWRRVGKLLGGIELQGGGAGVGPVSMSVALKVDRTFRQRVREVLANQLPRLVSEVREHHRDVLDALRSRWGEDTRLVVIVDSLEHLRGQVGQTEAVARSVQDLLYGHARHLQLPSTHMVLSVPAFLALQADNLAAQYVNGAVQAWTSVQVTDRSGLPRVENIARLRRLVSRRGDWRRILPNQDALDRLVLGSGGYLRDLLNMMIEAIHVAGVDGAKDPVDEVLDVARRSYQPLYADEIAVLRKIAETRDLSGVTRQERPYLVRFLDSHLVLAYLDGTFWYDVHPLVREQVVGG